MDVLEAYCESILGTSAQKVADVSRDVVNEAIEDVIGDGFEDSVAPLTGAQASTARKTDKKRKSSKASIKIALRSESNTLPPYQNTYYGNNFFGDGRDISLIQPEVSKHNGIAQVIAKPKITAFVCNKGGTGKTTSCVNVAGWLAQLGKKVLVIDLDPQASASSGLGMRPQQAIISSADALTGLATLSDLTIKTQSGVYLIPANADLMLAEREMLFDGNSATRLGTLLSGLGDTYDHIFIDPPAGHGILSINAITACDDIILPLDSSIYAKEAGSLLLDLFEKTEKLLGRPINVSAILLRRQPGLQLEKLLGDDLGRVKHLFKDCEFKPRIFMLPFSTTCERAVEEGLPLANFAPIDKLSRAYSRVAKFVSA